MLMKMYLKIPQTCPLLNLPKKTGVLRYKLVTTNKKKPRSLIDKAEANLFIYLK